MQPGLPRSEAGLFGGPVTLVRATDESDVDSYEVYFGTEADPLLEHVASITPNAPVVPRVTIELHDSWGDGWNGASLGSQTVICQTMIWQFVNL